MNVQGIVANVKPSFVVSEAQSKLEAFGLILSGLWYFLEHNTKMTLAALLFMAGSSLTLTLLGYLYMKTDSISIQRAEPIRAHGDSGFDLSLQSKAYAGERFGGGDSIVVNGSFYGYSDPSFKLWKLYDKSAILIYDRVSGEVLVADAPIFTRSKLRQLSK